MLCHGPLHRIVRCAILIAEFCSYIGVDVMASRTIERILSEALELPEAERAELAHGLVASLDGPNDEAAAGAWDEEILRRMKELEAGTATTVNRDEFRRRIRERLSRI